MALEVLHHRNFLLTFLGQVGHHIDVVVDVALDAVDVEARHIHSGNLDQIDKMGVLGLGYVVIVVHFQMKTDAENHRGAVDQSCHTVAFLACHEMDFVDHIDGMMQIPESKRAYVLENRTVLMEYV